MNFDGKDIRIIANLYWGQVAVVRHGCVLSPYLFDLLTEMIFREVDPTWDDSVEGKRLTSLRYPDDTALMAEAETELQCIGPRVNEVGKDFGMK